MSSPAGKLYPKSGAIIRNWDLRGFVLITLFLQTLLLLVAPFRKQTSSPKLLGLVWFTYILSDWASNYAVGLILATKVDQERPNSPGFGSEILMFWAPFLLLHVGGADSITALSSSDNELWSRFAIQLATMTCGFGSAFYRSFLESRLRIPVLLMFVAGLTKYLERLWSLFRARFSSLKESLLEEKIKSCHRSLDLDCNQYELSDAKMVSDASRLFESFKGIFVDLQVDSEDRRKTKEYFRRRSPGDAFRVVEIELNFSYDLFYSKGPVIRQGIGRILRPLCIVCQLTSLVLWVRIDKRSIDGFDVRTTYALLLGALARDFMSILMMTCSDWTIASVVRNSDDSQLINKWLSLRKQRWYNYSIPEDAPLTILLSRALLRRWSESISQLNFIDLCFDDDSEVDHWHLKWFALHFFFNKVRPAPTTWFTNDLRDFIFQELNKRATQDKVSLRRGEWTLESYSPGDEELLSLSKTYVANKTFDESLLMWHIATTLCTQTENQESLQESEKRSHEFSKTLSDYMLSLLIRNPEMTLEVAAMGRMRYEDTRAKAKLSFNALSIQYIEGDNIKEGCKELLREVGQHEGLEDAEHSVWCGARRLAIELKELEDKQVVKMWDVIAKVWVEMLSYGAARCSSRAHAAQLANGGELITLVWLLMEHLGLGKR